MAAQQQNRATLNSLFNDGERPTGEDFASAWMSFLNQNDDQILYDKNNNNIVFGPSTGLVLGNPTVGVKAGTLSFNSAKGTVQFYDGTVFKDIAGAAGAFVQVGTGLDVAFSAGNVGVGTGSTAPTHRLEVSLGNNTSAQQEILLGNLVIHNGPATDSTPGAYIGNNAALLTSAAGYALLQDNSGKTTINASGNAGSQLSLAIAGNDKFVIASNGSIGIDGDVSIGSEFGDGHTVSITNITPPDSPATTPSALMLFGDEGTDTTKTHVAALSVNGYAEKSQGGLTWRGISSDARVKKEIRVYKDGLKKLIELQPVIFKYNGKGGITDSGGDYIGLIAQDVKKVAPEIVFSRRAKLNPEDEKETELLNYDFHNVLFMFINAIKELSERIEKLEKAKKNEKRKTGDSTGIDD